MKKSVSIIVFSKDRVCQLEACLRSLFASMSAEIDDSISVLYQSSNPLFSRQYEALERDFPNVVFVKEDRFQDDFWKIIKGSEYSLFAVDDCLFTGNWSLDECCNALDDNPTAVGFSLRLGRNINYCYPMQCAQQQPEFSSLSEEVLSFDWTSAEYDFAYPLELSSSLYRAKDIERCLEGVSFNRPNFLEREMAGRSQMFRESQPLLLCFRQSVAFSCPINITQEVKTNYHGLNHPRDAEELARDYDRGLRIDIGFLKDFVPVSCHQEVEIKLKNQND